MTTSISNYDDLIDSRDVIARIAHLQQLRQPGPVDLGEEDNEQDQDTLFHELASLEALAEQCGNDASDWHDGATLIRDSYFEEYAQNLASDIGAISDLTAWPCCCIDWGQATRELQMDYSSVKFGDVTYWIR